MTVALAFAAMAIVSVCARPWPFAVPQPRPARAGEDERCNATQPLRPLKLTVYRNCANDTWSRMLTTHNGADVRGEALWMW